MRAIVWYNKVLGERPLATKSVTSFFIVGIGDVLSQYVEARSKDRTLRSTFDSGRFLKMAFFGGLYLAPVLHNWYGFLARAIPQPTTASVVKKLALDQTIFCNFVISSFFVYVTTANGGTWSMAVDKIKNDQWQALLMNWRIWPFVMAVNFSVIPVQFHVLFVNSVAVFWNAYLSYMANKPAA